MKKKRETMQMTIYLYHSIPCLSMTHEENSENNHLKKKINEKRRDEDIQYTGKQYIESIWKEERNPLQWQPEEAEN